MQRLEKGNLSCSGCGARLAGASACDLTMETIRARFSSVVGNGQRPYSYSCCRPDKAKLATERDGKSIPARTSGRT